MMEKTPIRKPLTVPDRRSVERQYGTLGPVYAATRAAAAEAGGREEAAREWREVAIDTDGAEETDLER